VTDYGKCKSGRHVMSPDNVLIHSRGRDRGKVRLCRACRRETERLAKQRYRAKRAAPRPPKAVKPRASAKRKQVSASERQPAKRPSRPIRAPAELRAAWRRSHSNSQIRRKYPTVDSLDRAWRNGELPPLT